MGWPRNGFKFDGLASQLFKFDGIEYVKSRDRKKVYYKNKKRKKFMESIDSIMKSLDHPEYYARDMETLEQETGLSSEEIKNLSKDKPINFFTFKNEDYVGTKDRKEAYDQDKELGINPFEEDTYKGDEYRKKSLNGKPRFRQG